MTVDRIGARDLLTLAAALGGLALLSGTARNVPLWLAIAAVTAAVNWFRKQGRGVYR